MKKIIFVIIIVLGIFIIYKINQDKKIYYLSLGDEISNEEDSYTKYINDYLIKENKLEITVDNFYKKNMRTLDLIDIIKSNKQIDINNKKITIQNSLIKADVVTLSIGNNDLISKLTLYNLYSDEEMYNYIDTYLNDLDNLLSIIRRYCKEKIIFIGYYNIINDNKLNKYYEYLISRTKKITNNYKIDYLDIYDSFEDLKYRSKGLYPNKDGYNYIGKEIVKIIDE